MIKTFICKQCGNQFNRDIYPSRNTYDYCSPACRNKARALQLVQCPVCKSMFSPQRINGADAKQKQFCSIKCAGYSRRGKPSTNPKKHSLEDRNFLAKYYPTMGADWVARQLGYSKNSITCLANKMKVVLNKDVYRQRVHGAAQKYMTGEKNPNWQGGTTVDEWGCDWQEQKLKARKRDNYTCQICGIKSIHISVHHIQRRRFFIGHMKDANVLSNLICLCNKHHILVEMGKIPCPVPKP